MTGAQAPSSRLWRYRVGIGLVLILAFGAALRVQYALPGLDSHRFWDERYNFDNVRKVLDTWSFEPGSAYYPSPLQTWPQALTVAASQWLYEEHGIEAAQTVHPRGWFTPTAYLLVRMISVAYGTATLVFLFFVGRRLISPGMGLLAALTLAALPWHIHVSSKFKPDALLVLGVVLAFHCSLIAIERARPRDYAWAGLAICLAMSAKVMGGLVSLTLVVGTMVIGWRDRRRLALLALAAGTSLISFLILNPYARYYLVWVAHLQGDYAKRAEIQGMTREGMPEELADYLFGPYVHGPIFATLALVGLAWLTASLWHPLALAPVGRAHRAMLVVFPPLYAGAYLVSTPYFKGNNVLPIVPFTILAALWLIWGLGRSMQRRAPALQQRAPQFLGAAGLVFALGSPGPLYVYRTQTPSTFDRAIAFLMRGAGPQLGRVLFTEEGAVPTTAWETAPDGPGHPPGLFRMSRLQDIEQRRLDLSDGEVFLEKRLDGARADFYRRRIGKVPAEHVMTFEPSLFELRGPSLVASRHPRRLAVAPRQIRMSRCRGIETACYAGRLPEGIEAGHLVSLVAVLSLGVLERIEQPPPLLLAGVDRPLIEVARNSQSITAVTERFIVDEGERRVRLSTSQPRQRDATVAVEIRRWRQPRAPKPRREP